MEKWDRVLHSHIAILHEQRRFIRTRCVRRDHAQSSVISGLSLALDRGTLSKSRGAESMGRMRRAVEILLFRWIESFGRPTRDGQAGRPRRRLLPSARLLVPAFGSASWGSSRFGLPAVKLPPVPTVS